MYKTYGFYKTPAVSPDENDGYYITSSVSVRVFGEVAFTGADSPFDPGAKLYLKVRANAEFASDGWIVDSDTLSNEAFSIGTASTIGSEITPRLVFKLSNSQPSCKLYGSGEIASGGTDLVLEAKEWWPYANPITGLPVWDTTTGLPA